MKRSRFSEEQIIGVLKEAEATTVKGACAKYNISEASYYNWKRKYGGMDVDEARRLRALEDENGRLKRLLRRAEQRVNPQGPGLSGSGSRQERTLGTTRRCPLPPATLAGGSTATLRRGDKGRSALLFLTHKTIARAATSLRGDD